MYTGYTQPTKKGGDPDKNKLHSNSGANIISVWGNPTRTHNTKKSLSSWGELGGISEAIVDGWVSQVVSQVLEWALASDNSLDEETEHREHSQASVLDFLDLELSKGVWVISQSKRIERVTWVELVIGGAVELTSGTESLSLTHKCNLDSSGEDNALSMDQTGVSEVVEATITEDGCTSLEPDGLDEVNSTGAGEVFWHNASQSTQHGPAGVDHFDFAVLGEGLWVSRETCGVPAVVTWVLSLQVAWGLSEGSQEEWAAWAVPLNSGAGDLASALREWVRKDMVR